jgi:hypothetical protein
MAIYKQQNTFALLAYNLHHALLLLAQLYYKCICIQGFFVKGKGGRPDALRAANKLLRDALNGRSGAIISFYPPRSTSTASTTATSVDTKELPLDTPFMYSVDEIDTGTTAEQEQQFEAKVHSRKSREGTLTNREMRQAQAERDAITAVNDTTSTITSATGIRAGSYIENESSDSDDNDSNDETKDTSKQQQQQQQSGAFAALDSSSDDTSSSDGISD